MQAAICTLRLRNGGGRKREGDHSCLPPEKNANEYITTKITTTHDTKKPGTCCKMVEPEKQLCRILQPQTDNNS